MTKLYKYNRITGYWTVIRSCDQATAQQWLAMFQADEPAEQFVLSTKKPRS